MRTESSVHDFGVNSLRLRAPLDFGVNFLRLIKPLLRSHSLRFSKIIKLNHFRFSHQCEKLRIKSSMAHEASYIDVSTLAGLGHPGGVCKLSCALGVGCVSSAGCQNIVPDASAQGHAARGHRS